MLSKKVVLPVLFIILIYSTLEIPTAKSIASQQGDNENIRLQEPQFFQVINGTWSGNISSTAKFNDNEGIWFYPSMETYYVNATRGTIEFQVLNETSFGFISNVTVNLEITMIRSDRSMLPGIDFSRYFRFFGSVNSG